MARVIVQEQAANNFKILIKSAIENQLRIITFGIAKTRRKLEEMEKESGMNTKEFYDQFREGKLGDEIRYIRWAGEYETFERLNQDLSDLQDLELCS